MHSNYFNPAIRQLRDQQVRFAPREKKLEQANQAERLLAELDPDRVYPYEYLCYRITNYRPESYPDLKVTGREASHDLRLFVEDLSDSADVPADEAGEPVLTVEKSAAASTSRPRRFPAGGGRGWSAGGSCSTAASGWGSCRVPWSGSWSRTRSGSAAARSSAS